MGLARVGLWEIRRPCIVWFFFFYCFILFEFGVVCVGQSSWCAKDFFLFPRPQAGAVLPTLVLWPVLPLVPEPDDSAVHPLHHPAVLHTGHRAARPHRRAQAPFRSRPHRISKPSVLRGWAWAAGRAQLSQLRSQQTLRQRLVDRGPTAASQVFWIMGLARAWT